MSKDYRKYSDSKLESEYERTGKYDVEKEMDRRGLLDYDDDDYDDEYEEKRDNNDNPSSGGTFSGIIGLLIVATIIGLFIEPKGTIEVIKTVFMFIAYGILKIIEWIF